MVSILFTLAIIVMVVALLALLALAAGHSSKDPSDNKFHYYGADPGEE
jgi:hypothetical protein